MTFTDALDAALTHNAPVVRLFRTGNERVHLIIGPVGQIIRCHLTYSEDFFASDWEVKEQEWERPNATV